MITQDRDLHTGKAVWTAYRKPRIPVEELTANISADITVVGGGISGAMIAESLAGQGLDVVIVDKRKSLSGSTAASTALIQYEIDFPLCKLSRKIGAAKAAAAWRRSRLAVESLAMKIRALDIECDFERKDSLYIAGNVLNSKGLEEEELARAVIGLPSILLSRKELRDGYGMHAQSALLSQGNIACNPVQLTAGFLNAAMDNGVRFFSPVEIEEISHRKNHILLTTTEGRTIKTRYVIHTTGYEIPLSVQTRKHKIYSTWALATRPVKGLDLPLFWEAGDPYFYGRTTMDGRMIFGGEDEEFSDEERRDALTDEKRKILERKLSSLLPDHKFATSHVWAGSFGASTTGLPSMGRIPKQKNSYAVMAYGGNGITFSRLAAEIITADILGHRDPDAKLFGFR